MTVQRRPPALPGGSVIDPVRSVTNFVVLTAEPSDALVLVARRMRLFDCGALLVNHGDTQKGILSERDVLRALADCHTNHSAGELATPDPLSISAEADIGDAAALMTVAGVRHLLVRDGERWGIVSMRDLVAPLLTSALGSEVPTAASAASQY